MSLINKNAYIYYLLYLSKHILVIVVEASKGKDCISPPLTSIKLKYIID